MPDGIGKSEHAENILIATLYRLPQQGKGQFKRAVALVLRDHRVAVKDRLGAIGLFIPEQIGALLGKILAELMRLWYDISNVPVAQQDRATAS